MFRSVRWRIILPYVALILLVMAGLGVYLSNFVRQSYLNDEQSKLASEARLVAAVITPGLQSAGANPDFDQQARYWGGILDARLTIIAPDGTVWGESTESHLLLPSHSDRPEVIAALASGEGSSIRYSQTLGVDMLYTAVKVVNNNQTLGLVRLAVPLQAMQANIAYLQRVIIAATAGAVILAILLSTLIAGYITRPLRDLTHSAVELASGLPGNQPVPTGKDEIEQLSQVFTGLASQLSGQINVLEVERARLNLVLQKMTDGVVIVDAGGLVQLVNPAAEKMFSITHSPAVGKPLIEVVHHHQPVEMWQRCQASGEAQRVEFEVGLHLSLQGIATSLSPAIPGSTLLLFQDLTRQRQIEIMRRDFISNVSHELRTPLAALKALTETLQEGALADPPAAHRFLEQMETEVDSLSLMVNELLELSRIESGRVPLNLVPTRPIDIIQPALERLKLQAERNNLTLGVDCSETLPVVLADPGRIQQVLVNLLHNAIKFTPPGGQVMVAAHLEDGMVRFATRDTGIGIAPDDLPRIFERFYKVDRSRATSGTGLGLAIARHLVEAHGGSIWAESQPGKGSTFYFTIPTA